MNNTKNITSPRELLDDLKNLVSQAEAMISESGTEHSAEAVESIRTRFRAAQERFAEFYDGARRKVVAGAKCTDEAIRSHPYESIAVAAGVGLLVGVLLGRRGK